MQDKIIQIISNENTIYGLSKSGKFYELWSNEFAGRSFWDFIIDSPTIKTKKKGKA